MKKSVFLLFFGLAASVLTAAELIQPRLPNDPFGVEIYRLENGVTVVVSENRESATIAGAIIFPIGGVDDPDTKTGLAHYLEHLLFKGSSRMGTLDFEQERPLLDKITELYTKREKSTDPEERAELFREIDRLSGEAAQFAAPNEYARLMTMIGATGTNAFTSSHVTAYVDTIPSNELARYLKINRERFADPVFRGFHTELEVVYEELNMSMDNPSSAFYRFFNEQLFTGHPLGRPVIGTDEDLRNPSPARVMEFFNDFYTPENMIVILVGDLDSATAVAEVEATLGTIPPRPTAATNRTTLPPFDGRREATIALPLTPVAAMAWRVPGVSERERLIGDLVALALHNGSAGILDQDYIAKQLMLSAGASWGENVDGNHVFLIDAAPIEGKTLDETREMLEAALAKLKNGDFPEWLPQAVADFQNLQILNMKEYDSSVRNMLIWNMIDDAPWSSFVERINSLDSVTTEEITAWANRYLDDNHLVVTRTRSEAMPEEVLNRKLEKPPITPLEYDTTATSEFFDKIAAIETTPIEPVFPDVDAQTEVRYIKTANGGKIQFRSFENTRDDRYNLKIIFNTGTNSTPKLAVASSYLADVGTETMPIEDFNIALFRTTTGMSFSAGDLQTMLILSGLYRNYAPALELAAGKFAAPQHLESAYSALKFARKESRENSLNNPGSIFSAVYAFSMLGEQSPTRRSPSLKELDETPLDELIELIRRVPGTPAMVLYFGPNPEEAAQTLETLFSFVSEGEPLPAGEPILPMRRDETVVFFIPHASAQSQVALGRVPGEYTPELHAVTDWFNEYFGGSMDSIMFQTLRESMSLAYSAGARYTRPGWLNQLPMYSMYISTQNDKLAEALAAMLDLGFPVYLDKMENARKQLLTTTAVRRLNGITILAHAEFCERMKLPFNYLAINHEKLKAMSTDELIAFYNDFIKGDFDAFAIVGDVDPELLKTYGEVITLTPADVLLRAE